MKLSNRITVAIYTFLVMALIGCTEEPVPIAVTSVSLNSTSMELIEGSSQTLVATVSPSNADNQKVIWTSNNSSVATVTDGVVTAIKAGTATITVKTDDGGKTATCNVTVVAKEIPVTSVSLDQTAVEITEGGEVTLNATVKPDDATNKNVTWTSSDESVAIVDNGKITAVKEGTATITVKTDDGGKTATCNVTVVAKEIPVTSVSLDQTEIELIEGDELTLTATVKPENATNKNVTWSSSNSSVATVTDGVVTAIKAGTATITVKTDDGAKTATCNVTVVAKEVPVTSVSLDQTEIELIEGDELTLTATVKPENATNKNVTWSSSNSSVATVTDGVVTAIKAGTATITVKTDDGAKTATCNVTVLSDKPNDVIVFADDIMKELCINAFDTNGDGELSYAEAAAVTDLSQMKLTKKTFKSFDEFQYFTRVTTVPKGYFARIGIMSIILPYNLKSISNEAFAGCSNLQSINIPESLTHIGKDAFLGCKSLKSIDIPESVTSIGVGAFQNCSSLQSIDIPESVTNIGGHAFRGCSNLQSINIPDSVTSIDDYTFGGCKSLKSIDIPDSVTSIGDSAFAGCSSLKSIVIPESVTSIDICAFQNCSSLQSINIPESVAYIEYATFQGCSSLKSIVIPESVTSIGYHVFYGCSSLQSIDIPDSVITIGGSAFAGCSSLQSIDIPEYVTSINEYTFEECTSLKSITIPESVTSIAHDAFSGCSSLQSITIPESVTSIGSGAFADCSSLQSITIPESVTTIGSYAFYDCSSLKKIYVKSQDCPEVGSGSFNRNASSRKIYVPYKVRDAYKKAEGWSAYAADIVGYDYENNKVVE